MTINPKMFTAFVLAASMSIGVFSFAAAPVDVNALAESERSELVQLNHILKAERFYYYLMRQLDRLSNKADQQTLNELRKLAHLNTILSLYPNTDFSNPDKYDGIIEAYLKKAGATSSIEQIKWDYPFFKRKLSEGFNVQVSKDKPLLNHEISQKAQSEVSVPNIDPNLTLDGGLYTSDRTTQAAFAFAKGRKLEFHMGPQIRFFEEVQRLGGTVVGEISPISSNYNKTYVYSVPGEKQLRIALTELYGQDRVNHLLKSARLVLHDDRPTQTQIIGDLNETQRNVFKQIKALFDGAPNPDEVIIGQKGAFANAFAQSYKIGSLRSLFSVAPDSFKELPDAERKKIGKIIAEAENKKSDMVFLEESSLVDKVFERLKDRMITLGFDVTTKTYDFDIEIGPFNIQDVEFKSQDGKIKRFRFISNVWGDEVTPMLQAIGESGAKKLVYIGTAGAFLPSGLKVGDVLVPTSAQALNGEEFTFDKTHFSSTAVTKQGKVTTVDSIFDESYEWLNNRQNKFDAVEVETAHLAKVAKMYNLKTDVFLLISDVVGTHETLAHSSSSKRKKSQLTLIRDLFDHHSFNAAQVSSTPRINAISKIQSVNKKLFEFSQGKDPVFKYYIDRVAEVNSFNSVAEVDQYFSSSKTFTTNSLQKRFLEFGNLSNQIMDQMLESGLSFKWAPDLRVSNGTFNPKTDVMNLFISVENANDLAIAREVLKGFETEGLIAKKQLVVSIAQGNVQGVGKSDMIPFLGNENGDLFLRRYADFALLKGGMILKENSSGSISFSTFGLRSQDARLAQMAFFAANPETLSVLNALNSKGEAEKILKSEIQHLNDYAERNSEYWKVELKEVSQLPNGELARIVPVLDKKSVVIRLDITAAGKKNYGVVLEEVLHLYQITNAPVKNSKDAKRLNSFIHPMHWLEVLENVRSGSWEAMAKVDKEELKAIRAAEFAVEAYLNSVPENKMAKSVKEFFSARKKHAMQRFKESRTKGSIEKSKRSQQFEGQRKAWDYLESSAKSLQTLIAANDRVGVKKLLEAYLPWDLMGVSEQNSWRKYLQSMTSSEHSGQRIVFVNTPGSAQYQAAGLQAGLINGKDTSALRRLHTVRRVEGKIGKNAGERPVDGRNLGGEFVTQSVILDNQGQKRDGLFINAFSLESPSVSGGQSVVAIKISEERLILDSRNFAGYLIPMIIFPDEVLGQVKLDQDIRTNKNARESLIGKLMETRSILQINQSLKESNSQKDFMSDYFESQRKSFGIGYSRESMSPFPKGLSCRKLLL